MVEELRAGAHHHLLGYGEHPRVHGELLSLSDLDQQHSEVGSAKVESEELAGLLPGGQVAHVGGIALDRGGVVVTAAESLVYGITQALLDSVDVVVVDDEIATQIFDAPPVVRDDPGLVRLHRRRGHALQLALLRRRRAPCVGEVLDVLLVRGHDDDDEVCALVFFSLSRSLSFSLCFTLCVCVCVCACVRAYQARDRAVLGGTTGVRLAEAALAEELCDLAGRLARRSLTAPPPPSSSSSSSSLQYDFQSTPVRMYVRMREKGGARPTDGRAAFTPRRRPRPQARREPTRRDDCCCCWIN